jgi:hypothetical protein
LALDCEEAMFGGAVGGGKTEALMMWLSEGVKYDGFSGLFLRRTFAQLTGSVTAPIERSFRFFQPLGGVFNSGLKTWTFPNGSMVRFGHMQHENDKHNYDGHEYQRIVADQCEQLSETQYEYMFSRLRRTVDFPLPCGIRSSSNPIGNPWVKTRFVSQEAIDMLKSFTAQDPSPPGMIFDSPCGGKFVPSRIADNPSLQVDEYITRLQTKLGAVLAARLANGDWSIVEGALIDPEQLRYYTDKSGQYHLMRADGKRFTSVSSMNCQRLAIVDTAGTSKQKAAEEKGKNPSWSVCGIFDYWHDMDALILRHIWRERVDWRGLKSGIAKTLDIWGRPKVVVENAHHGQVLWQELQEMKYEATLVNTMLDGMKTSMAGPSVGAKQERAIASGLFGRLESGQLYLPDVQTCPGVVEWMPELESELLRWTGKPDDAADQIDVISYACNHFRKSTLEWGGVLNTAVKRW